MNDKIKLSMVIVICALAFLLCGCSKKECIKSHQQEGICLITQCMSTGKTVMCIPISYPCVENICDEWSE